MRDDLLALTPERLAVLANPGLVKRAQKELAGGAAPSLEESADGAVHATFTDGARTLFPREVPLRSATCTCGAPGACRHRVALVLAYQALHAVTGGAAEAQRWDPGQVSDEALLALCGEAQLAAARKRLAGSLLVTARPGALPVAELPSATVQFLVPNVIAAAKCDCVKQQGCEHVVLGVWAFRRAPEGGLVELGSGAPTLDLPALASVGGALERIAAHGLTDVGAPQALATARAVAAQRGWVWVADALEALEQQQDAYGRQSALFSGAASAELVAELHARLAAARASGPLPAGYVLGSDGPDQSALEQVRLTSLGARLEADDPRRLARIYFAEPTTGAVLMLEKEWRAPPGTPPKNGHDLGELFASSRLSVSALARSELITRAARRRANGLVDLSVARGMKTALLSVTTGWEQLPPQLLISDLAAHAVRLRGRPPRLLRPRQVGEDVHAVALGEVREIAWDAGEQCLVARVTDRSGAPLLLKTPHRTVSPGAVDAVASALAQAPRFVSGRLVESRDGWELCPLAILGERLVVPDLELPSPRPLPQMESGARNVSALEELLSRLASLAEVGLLKGMGAAKAPAAALAPKLEAAGMARLAERVRKVSLGQPAALLEVALLSALGRTEELA